MHKYILLIFSVVSSFVGYGQFRTPNSANEAGWVQPSVFSQNRFAGQLSAAYVGGFSANFQNPATYADATLTSIEVGAMSVSGAYQLTDSSNSSAGLGLSHFAIQMPLSVGKSGLCFGLYRNSNTNYSIKHMSYDSTFGSFANQLKGNGNIYQAFVGSGFRFGNFKVGANVGISFGSVIHSNSIVFPDSLLLPQIAKTNAISELGLHYTLGTQYDIELSRDRQLILGGYYTSSLSKSGTVDYTRQTIFNKSGVPEYVTLNDTNYDVSLPKMNKIGVGATFIRDRSLLLGTEFNFADYSSYKNILTGLPLQKSWHIHLGAEYKPFMHREFNSRKYWNKITYRCGAVIGKSEQNFSGSLNDLKIMGGATLPILGRNIGYLTLGAEYGMRGFGGTTGDISERTFSLHLILTFADKWFLRPKFD